MQVKLTADLVRVLTQQVPPAKEQSYWDIVVPRLVLRVRPPARPGQPWASAYLIRYVVGAGDRKLKLGSPDTMDLDTARKAARAKLAIVDQGGDPAADKAALRDRWTVRQAAEAYLASREFARKVPRAQAEDTATLRLHVVHHLAAQPLAEIDVPCVRRLMRKIEVDLRTNKRRRRLGGPGAARKTVRTLSAMLTWCVGEGQLERNPLIGALRLDGDNARETVISTAEEYAALFTAMDAMVAAGTLRPLARAFITVSALTGMRRGELQSLQWKQVDLAARRITLSTSKGAKLARGGVKTETISLPPFAAAALAAIRPDDAEPNEPVFVPRRGAKVEINRDWLRVRERAGLPADLVLHGLRHSAGTVAVLAGLSGPEVQKLLRHRNIATTAKYIHLADRARLQDRAMAGMAPDVPGEGEALPAKGLRQAGD